LGWSWGSSFQIAGQFESGLNVFVLGLLVASSQQNDQDPSSLDVINPIAWSVVDAQFGNTFTDGLHVSREAMDETVNPGLDAGESLKVFQPIDPSRELMGFNDFLHGSQCSP
jgi:hypothetical protein